jgi:hypothetical protein
MEERDDTTVSTNTQSAITHLLTAILKGEANTVAKLCTPNIMCKFGSQIGKGFEASGGIREMCRWAYLSSDVKCSLSSCCSQSPTSDVVFFTGDYQTEYFPHGKSRLVHGDYTIMLVSGKIFFIEITQDEQLKKCIQIKAVNESVYYIDERKILYLESMRDHLLLHYEDIVIESVQTLTHVSNVLSADFVRIHRSYLVNRSHVSNIKRCDDRHCIVTMTNGDILPVPYQKFVAVREELMNCEKSAAAYQKEH